MEYNDSGAVLCGTIHVCMYSLNFPLLISKNHTLWIKVIVMHFPKFVEHWI